jgi:hypothetical protein
MVHSTRKDKSWMGSEIFTAWSCIETTTSNEQEAHAIKPKDVTTPKPKSAPLSWAQVAKGDKQ